MQIGRAARSIRSHTKSKLEVEPHGVFKEVIKQCTDVCAETFAAMLSERRSSSTAPLWSLQAATARRSTGTFPPAHPKTQTQWPASTSPFPRRPVERSSGPGVYRSRSSKATGEREALLTRSTGGVASSSQHYAFADEAQRLCISP